MIEYSCAECSCPAMATCPTCGVTYCARHFGALLLCENCVERYDVATLGPHFICSCCWSAEIAGVFND